MPIYYNYNKLTGEYIPSEKPKEAKKNPLENEKYLLPAGATFVPPPETGENEIAVFENDSWVTKEDFRGTILYDKETKEEYKISNIGDTKELLSEKYTNKKPDHFDSIYFDLEYWNDSEEKWEFDFKKLKARVLENLDSETSNKIGQLKNNESKAKTLFLEWVANGSEGNPPVYWTDWKVGRDTIMREHDTYEEWINDNNRTTEDLLNFTWE